MRAMPSPHESQAARTLAQQVSSTLGLKVYPFSVFHVFFEQYLTIASDSVKLLLGAMLGVWIVCCVLTGMKCACLH